jgi:trk system potassium uptake protein
VLIVIAGCGRVGSELALTLSEEGHDVSIVDDEKSRLDGLGASFNGRTTIGLAYDVRTLRAADIEFADAFVAVTSNDNANVMAVQLAKKVFGVPRTIARLDDPARADVYRTLDVEYVLGAHLVAVVIHERITSRGLDLHVTFSDGDVEIVEMLLGPSVDGVRVADFQVPDRVRVSAIERDGTTIIPSAETELRTGDLLVAAVRKGFEYHIAGYRAGGDA